MQNKKVIGYTTGVYDMFHIGHLNLLKNAKYMCDTLIVGCSEDEVVRFHKNKNPIIPFRERKEILESIKYVDKVVSQKSDDYIDKFKAWKKIKFDILFVGSDWKGSEKWISLEKKLSEVGAKVVYIDYTNHTSSTELRKALNKINS